MVEDFPGRHRNYPGSNALREQLVVGLQGQNDFAAGSDKDDLGFTAGGVGENISTMCHTRRRCVLGSVKGRQGLAREYQDHGLVSQSHDDSIGFNHFIGVGGPQCNQPWDGAQRRQVFYWLVSGTVLAIAHGVVSEDENGRQLHECGEPDGGTRVIAEDKE